MFILNCNYCAEKSELIDRWELIRVSRWSCSEPLLICSSEHLVWWAVRIELVYRAPVFCSFVCWLVTHQCLQDSHWEMDIAEVQVHNFCRILLQYWYRTRTSWSNIRIVLLHWEFIFCNLDWQHSRLWIRITDRLINRRAAGAPWPWKSLVLGYGWVRLHAWAFS